MIRLFRVSIPGNVLVLMCGDFLLVLLCYLIPAQWTQELPLDLYLWDDNGALAIGLVVLVMVVGLYLSDLYSNLRKQSTLLLLQQLCVILGVELLLQSVLSYLRSPLVLPRWLMLYAGIGMIVVLPIWRRVFTNVVINRLGATRVLFLGNSPVTLEVVKELLERPELGLHPVGYLETNPVAELDHLGIPRCGAPEQIKKVVAEQRPERVIVATSGILPHFPMESLLDLQFSGMPIERVSATYERIFGRVSTQSLQAAEVVFSPEMHPLPWKVLLQNLYSTLLGIVGLLLLWPLMIVVAVLVRLSSPGPALFRQTRVGRNKVPFTLYKFRSMYIDAEAKTGAVWASKNDPRITPLGAILRKLRLDELPQFFNVIRGDMSLVGPRPERPEFVDSLERQIPFFRQRMYVKPGITGWAQINHKYGNTLEDTVTKLEYDLYYIKHLAPSLDFYIIFHTIKVMLLSRGAQ